MPCQFNMIFSGIFENIWHWEHSRRSWRLATRVRGAPYPPGRAPSLVGPRWPSSTYPFTHTLLHLFHMTPPYLPIYGIYLPFQVNLYVPNSKPSNKHYVLYARIAHVPTRAALIFHAWRVILKRSGLRSSLTRKWLVTGMPSPML